MKTRILDTAALEAISPAALRAYVIFEGWRKTEPYGEYSEVYTRPDSEKRGELIVPSTTKIADYASAVGQLIRFLAKIEERDEISLYDDLSRADRDVIRVRAPDADDDGSIDIDTGVGIVHHSRELLASAACAAFDPRPTYHLGKVQQAEEYMRRVKLGQTERGSFVVTLIAPIPPALSLSGQATLWPDLEQEPYVRQVTRVLARALHAAHDAVVASNRGDGVSAFSGAVADGVSANLCEAVASIVDQADGAEVSVTWARTRPTPTRRDRINFGRADGEILKEAARQFRLREPRRDERIIGYVRHLHRPEDQFDGQVTIKAIIDGRARSLSVRLSQPDYEVAIQAHERQLPIIIDGDLEIQGHRWWLREPRDVRIADDENEE
jgi:hypothetical protein